MGWPGWSCQDSLALGRPYPLWDFPDEGKGRKQVHLQVCLGKGQRVDPPFFWVCQWRGVYVGSRVVSDVAKRSTCHLPTPRPALAEALLDYVGEFVI